MLRLHHADWACPAVFLTMAASPRKLDLYSPTFRSGFVSGHRLRALPQSSTDDTGFSHWQEFSEVTQSRRGWSRSPV